MAQPQLLGIGNDWIHDQRGHLVFPLMPIYRPATLLLTSFVNCTSFTMQQRTTDDSLPITANWIVASNAVTIILPIISAIKTPVHRFEVHFECKDKSRYYNWAFVNYPVLSPGLYQTLDYSNMWRSLQELSGCH